MSRAAKITRRGAIAGVSALAGASALSMPGPFIRSAGAQSGAVRIGLVMAKTGNWAEHGEASANAVKIAVEQEGGEILNRPLDVIWYDEPNPQTSQQNAQKLIEEDKVVAVIGGSNSATGMAMASVAARLKTPFIAHTSAAREITGKNCNRYTFRALATGPVFARAIVPAGLEYGKKWYFIVPAYAFGTDMYAAMKELLVQAGGTDLGVDQVPVGTTDFSSYILKIRQAKPDALVCVLVGSDLANFCKQYRELGLANRVPIIHPIHSDTDLWPLGGNIPKGLYGKGWHFNDPRNAPDEKAFVEAYRSKHKAPPTLSSYLAWISAKVLINAVGTANSTAPGDVVKALETVRRSDGDMPLYFRPWDHQLIRRSLLLAPKSSLTDPKDQLDVIKHVPGTAAELEALYGTPEEIGCTMGDI
jgi:branched-chain amino acid transport system substrate-binding protein